MTHDPRQEHPAGPLNVAVVLAPDGSSPGLGATPRRRSRLVATACAGVVTAAAIIAGTAAATGALPATGAAPRASASADAAQLQVGAAAQPAAASQPAGSVPTPPAEDPEARIYTERVGALIRTGTAHSGGKLTLWFSESNHGKLHLSLGARDAKGALRSFGDAVAASRRPGGKGFKAAYNAVNGDSEPREYALVGIVVGDVSRVTLTVDGKPRTARVAPWSEDPRVHAWWVLGAKLDRWPGKSQPIKGQVTGLTAYGPDGTVVARGDDGEIVGG